MKRLSISKLKVVKSRSFETLCFTAQLSFDGKIIADIDNEGTGGPNAVSDKPGCRELVKAAEEYANSLPAIESEFGLLSMNFDLAISTLVDEVNSKVELRKEFDKCANKGGVIKNGGVYTYKVNLKAMGEDQRSKVIATLKKQNPADAILLIEGDVEENFKKFCEMAK